MGPLGLGKIQQNLVGAKQQSSLPPTARVPRGAQTKSSASYASQKTDLGPWVETPNSSRVSRYRYDYLNDSMQVMWKNNKRAQSGPSSPTDLPGTVYGVLAGGGPISYEMFRGYARAVSKGKSVNSMLNNWGYKGMSVDEKEAPSNGRYSAPSRARD